MAALLILVAILTAVGGLLFLSQATTGVGIIGIACLLAIFARLAQASDQHKKAMQTLEEMKISLKSPQTIEAVEE